MNRRNWTFVVLLSVLLLVFALPSSAQRPSTEDLRKQIEALNQTIQAMQKDLQEIKALLQGKVQPPSPPAQKVVLELGGHPSKGESTAKLTLVEFSDYQ